MTEKIKLAPETLYKFGRILGKLILFPLNLFPSNVYETHGINNAKAGGRPDTRALAGSLVKDRRRLPFGASIIARQRGCVFKYERDVNYKWTGIYTEDYQDIVEKWCF